ncbi:MAG: YbaB/EbfC family nucleoid-associated protein [Patescibacteria group bacterium]|nr:YbaB/EbfC family nucleoid-associated protein [Patescibacteria group bacterium]MDD4611327.1 YbaB/EbfC family nucleoid-associated protein [Patescibacteria group bacterium]
MFNKLKQFRDLRSQAKTLQSALANESVTIEKGGVKLVMNGNMEVISLTINDGLEKNSLEGIITDCINDAIKKTQRIMAQKMQEMGGLPGLN